MKLWLYCHFPQLLLEQMQRWVPAARSQPIVLFQTDQQRERVYQRNAAAAAKGIEVGQTLVLAQSLSEQLICKPYQPEKEARVLQQLAEKLYQSVDQQVLFEPQGIAIAVDSLLRLYQGAQPLLEHLTMCFQQQHLSADLSFANSPLAAQSLARAGVQQASTERADIQRALASLSVSQLGLPGSTASQLRKSGIRRFGQLQALPMAQLGQRFGAKFTDWLMKMTGEVAAPASFFRPAETFSIDVDLVSEIEHWQGLLFPLKRALKELETFLFERQRAVTEIHIQLFHRQQSCTQVPLKLAADSWRASEFLQLLQLQVTRHPLKQPVIALRLQADQLHNLSRHSGQLLADGPQHRSELTELLSRLQAKLGESALYSPALSRDYRPVINERKQSPGQRLKASSSGIKRPLWILPEPQPINLQQWQLEEGPERLESGWWDEQPMQRDYWLARDPHQRLGWLFCQQQQWFLQGWFS